MVMYEAPSPRIKTRSHGNSAPDFLSSQSLRFSDTSAKGITPKAASVVGSVSINAGMAATYLHYHHHYGNYWN